MVSTHHRNHHFLLLHSECHHPGPREVNLAFVSLKPKPTLIQGSIPGVCESNEVSLFPGQEVGVDAMLYLEGVVSRQLVSNLPRRNVCVIYFSFTKGGQVFKPLPIYTEIKFSRSTSMQLCQIFL